MLSAENPSHPENATSASSWRRDLLLLTVAFGALFFWRLGTAPLANPDEGRYAEIPREMIASGDWVTPRLNGVNYFEKPPLMYWAVALSQRTFGLNEWAVRAPLALFGLGGVLMTYAAGRRLYGQMAGWWAAVVLGTSLLYFALARILLLDLAVSVLMSGALFCFILGVTEAPGARRRGLFYGLYASMALATLTKGLIGFLVTGAVMFFWLLIFNQWKRLRPLHLPTGALLFLAIAAPWHVLAAQHNETWAHRYFVYEHLERFLTPAASRPGPVWYFVPIVLFGVFPWTGFLWCSTRDAVSGGQAEGLRATWARRNENAPAWFLVVWAGFIFLFFSKSSSKLVPYILPIFPALAVLIGAYLARAVAEGPARLRWGMRIFTFVCGLLAVGLLVAVYKVGTIIREPAQADALRPAATVLAGALLIGGVVAPWLAQWRGVRQALTAVTATMVVFYAVLAGVVGEVQKPGTQALAEVVTARARPGDRVLHYHEFFHDFTYYARRVVDVVAFKGELELEEDPVASASGRFIEQEEEFRALWLQPGRIFAVARKKDVKELFDDAAFRYHLIAETRDHYLFSNLP